MDNDSDIVSELRDWAAIIDETQGKACVVMLSGQVFTDAADEIQRLQRACHSWEHIARLFCKADYIESLQKVGDLLVSAMKSGSDSHWDEIIDLWEELRNTHS